MKKLTFLLLFFFAIASVTAQNISGDWEGALDVQGTSLPLVFHFTKTDNRYTATMDSPLQQAFGFPVDEISFENNTLNLAITAIGMTYSATLDEKQSGLSGQFNQNGMELPLHLKKISKQE